MKTATYPALGSKVKYVRPHAQTGELEQGEATVYAICLDHTKRVMAHLSKPVSDTNAPHEKFNVDLSLLEPSEETLTKLKNMVDNVIETSKAANAKAQAIVDESNAIVEKHHSEVLGEPVTIDE